jgi:hypothetical protein
MTKTNIIYSVEDLRNIFSLQQTIDREIFSIQKIEDKKINNLEKESLFYFKKLIKQTLKNYESCLKNNVHSKVCDEAFKKLSYATENYDPSKGVKTLREIIDENI